MPAADKFQRIARLGARADVRLLAPLAFACSAQIESWPLADYLGDPTKLSNGVRGLNQALGTDVALTACAAAIEAEALGAALDWANYPPRLIPASASGHPIPEVVDEVLARGARMAASLEATRRLAATLRGTVLGVGLSGAATLAGELRTAGFAVPQSAGAADTAYVECAGRICLAAAKRFLLAGAKLVFVVERSPPAQQTAIFQAWLGALRALNNVANFHQAVACLLSPAADWPLLPNWLRICPLRGTTAAGGHLLGHALGVAPSAWGVTPIPDGIVTTVAELPAAVDLDSLKQACLVLNRT